MEEETQKQGRRQRLIWNTKRKSREQGRKPRKHARKLREVQAETRAVLPLGKAMGVSRRFCSRTTKARRETANTRNGKAGAYIVFLTTLYDRDQAAQR